MSVFLCRRYRLHPRSAAPPGKTYPVRMEDPAFVWKQPDRPVRPMRPPAGERAQAPDGASSATRWVTLHDAEEATGVPASTVRNWARKERVPTRFELTPEGQVRMVGLDEVVARARHLGRLRPQSSASPGPAPPPPPATASEPVEDSAEGSVLVPLDAWNKMINQLGNLHEAGQQLAEARERAARAETEAAFLRERLSELRRQVEQPSGPQPLAPEPEPDPLPGPGTSDVEPAWLYLYRRWENRSRRRR